MATSLALVNCLIIPAISVISSCKTNQQQLLQNDEKKLD